VLNLLVTIPLQLDKIDTAILKSLLQDGRKSFRQISRDTGMTTPTVKARYEKLVNVGFIKGVLPIFDFEKIESNAAINLLHIQDIKESSRTEGNFGKNQNNTIKHEIIDIEKRITTGLAINIKCDFCDGPVYGKPRILKSADIDRFFCCTSCKLGYAEKYQGRIGSIKRKYDGKSEMDE